MPIGGAVVIAMDMKNQQQLANLLEAELGLEVSGVGPTGIAIIVESETMKEMTSLTNNIKQLKDVADVQVIYCNWEDQV